MDILEEDVIKLGLSFLIGAIIGFEREYRSKSAGLRTMILICMGSTLFTILSIKVSADAGRIAANIVTGIGFIGAGIIFRENNRLVGITTAAIVWVSAAIGMGIGAGYFQLTIVTFLISGLSLIILTPVQSWIHKRSQIRHYRIKCHYHKSTLNHYEQNFKEFNLKILLAEQNRSGNIISGHWMLQGSEANLNKLTAFMLNDTEILELDF